MHVGHSPGRDLRDDFTQRVTVVVTTALSDGTHYLIFRSA